MPRGRKPTGERALTGAERQARYRATHAGRPFLQPLRWLDALPEALRDGATGEALQAIVDLDLDELASIEPPRGFGRD